MSTSRAEKFFGRGEKTNQKFRGPQKRKKLEPKDFPSSPRSPPPCAKTN
jgi:hypothetical protein